MIGRIATWLDVQLQYVDIGQQPQPQIAPHVVAVMGDTVVTVATMTTALIPARHLPRRVVAVGLVVAGLTAQNRAGRELAHLWCTRMPKYSHLHQSVRLLKLEQFNSLTFVMYFCAMHGMTDKE
ncbi:hypothetical protein D3C72_1583090 [compost metagenome]